MQSNSYKANIISHEVQVNDKISYELEVTN